jgi:hypothetical protein
MNGGVFLFVQQVPGDGLESFQRVGCAVFVDTVEATVFCVFNDLGPDPLGIPHNDCRCMGSGILGKQGGVHAAQHHGHVSFPEPICDFIGPRGQGRHTGDADEVRLGHPGNVIDLLVDDLHLHIGGGFRGHAEQAQQGKAKCPAVEDAVFSHFLPFAAGRGDQ